MSNDEIYQLVDFICRSQDRKELVNPSDFNLLLQKANLDKFRKEIGIVQDFAGSQPTSRAMVETSQIITEALRPFKEYIPAQVVTTGHILLPVGYYYPTALNYSYNTRIRPIEVLTDAQWGWRQYDSNKGPTLSFPIARFLSDRIEILPSTIALIQFTYMRTPVTPLAVYKSEYGTMVYDSSASVELEWDETNKIDILNLILLDMGVVVDPSSITQYASMKKQQGV